MLDLLKSFFKNDAENISEENFSDEDKIKIATCALFMEMADSDDDFSEEEKKLIIVLMKKHFDLSEEEVEELIILSEEHIKQSVSLYEFTEIINSHFSKDEKLKVVASLWELIYIDEQLHQHEDYFIRKISNNLHLSHGDMIAMKLAVKNSKK